MKQGFYFEFEQEFKTVTEYREKKAPNFGAIYKKY
jgi:hypothetical protein